MKENKTKNYNWVFWFDLVLTCIGWMLFANSLFGKQTNLIALGIQLVCCIVCSVGTGWAFKKFL